MTSIPPLVKSIGWTRGITDTRAQMLDLQRQLGTGRIAETYGGLGSGRSLALSMQGQLARIDNFQQTIDTLALRLDMMSLSVDRFAELVDTTKSDARNGTFEFSSGDTTLSQDLVKGQFDEALSLLNAEIAGRHLFSGRTVDQKPVEATQVILHGDGVRAGLDTLIAERKLADAGADGRGRLQLTNGGASLTIAEDGDHPFGFKLAGISSSIAAATLTQPGGVAPQSAGLALAGQPVVGDTVEIALDLPDASRVTITLTASADGSAENSFAIGADETATLANIEAAIGTALETAAATDLSASSSVVAARSFFAADIDNPPQRIDGPPFESATGLVAGTADNTVIWYRGEPGTGSARDSSLARIDDNIVVGYGARANEEPFSWALAHMAAFAIEDFDESVATDDDRFYALRQKTVDGLSYGNGVRGIRAMQAEYVGLQSTYGAAQERHVATKQIAEDALAGVTQADDEEVAVKLLQLQTQLQISYQATAMIAQLNLAQYL